MPPKAEADHRATARDFAKHGIAELARAFNHCHNPKIGYRYSAEVQRRFVELGVELVELVEHGEIVSRATMAAEEDAVFQRHVTTLFSLASPDRQRHSGLEVPEAHDNAILTRADLMSKLNCSRETVRQWLKVGKLPPPDVAISRKTMGWKRSTLNAAGIRI